MICANLVLVVGVGIKIYAVVKPYNPVYALHAHSNQNLLRPFLRLLQALEGEDSDDVYTICVQ